jgi:hypothetical protein
MCEVSPHVDPEEVSHSRQDQIRVTVLGHITVHLAVACVE